VGFSYGDVLGAGEGWAKSILYHAGARDQFQRFLDRRTRSRSASATAARCSPRSRRSCRARELAALRAQSRRAVRGRFSLVELQPSPSIFLAGMDGSMLPIAVAHGEGRAEFASDEARERSRRAAWCRRVTSKAIAGRDTYPANPNGSPSASPPSPTKMAA
jgi:phosphoribosylformylglycinamidine synthase